MKTVDLTAKPASIEEILRLAEQQNLLVRTAEGRVFVVAEVDRGEADDDFAQEVAVGRHNQALRQLLNERSAEPGTQTISQVRERFGLGPAPE
jgi:hypothetical protein